MIDDNLQQDINSGISEIKENMAQMTEQEQPEPVENQAEQQTHPQETAPAKSFRELREQKDRAEARAYELEQMLRQREQPQQQPEEDDFQMGDDDLVAGKNFTKYVKRIKELEKKLDTVQKYSASNSAEAKLLANYPDAKEVLSNENLSLLAKEHPDLAHAIDSTQDFYSKAASAYKLIKQFGIYRKDEYVEDKERAQKNLAKPRPSVSVQPQQGDSPLSKANAFANGLTPELQKQLWKEMNQLRKDF